MVKSIETRISDFLGAYEKLRDAIKYPIKTPMDRLTCVICNGRYNRRDKSKHSRTKKHQYMLPLVLTNKVYPYIEWVDNEMKIDKKGYDKAIEEPKEEQKK